MLEKKLTPGQDRSAVIVISSHVARGSVGNRACVFALEALEIPVWAVPTVLLPWHPGHGPATRIVPPADAFTEFMHDLERAPWLGEVGAVLSGYLGEAGQAESIASLVRRVKSVNPDALYVCDPVMGDLGGLYIADETAVAIRDMLMPLADIATPNRYELAWLMGKPLETLEAICKAASRSGRKGMLVTSAPGIGIGTIANLLLMGDEAHLAEHAAVTDPAKGPGDLTSALFLAWLLRGAEPAEALRQATAAVFETLANTAARGFDELMLETDASCLSAPTAEVTLRQLTRFHEQQ